MMANIMYVILILLCANVVIQFMIRTGIDFYLEIKEKLKHENTEH